MADYKDIVGTKVTVVSSNPINPTDGQVWYNTTDNVLRYRNPASTAAWASGGNLNTGRNTGMGFGGTQNTSMYAGGYPDTAAVETFNGSTWSEVSDLNDSRRQGSGGGGQAAGWVAGGYGGSPTTNSNQTETWGHPIGVYTLKLSLKTVLYPDTTI